jgi:hypothetical protein
MRVARVPEIRLTDSLPRVVARSPRRNRLWYLVTAPLRLLKVGWDWLLESKPAASHRLHREPPGFR